MFLNSFPLSKSSISLVPNHKALRGLSRTRKKHHYVYTTIWEWEPQNPCIATMATAFLPPLPLFTHSFRRKKMQGEIQVALWKSESRKIVTIQTRILSYQVQDYDAHMSMIWLSMAIFGCWSDLFSREVFYKVATQHDLTWWCMKRSPLRNSFCLLLKHCVNSMSFGNCTGHLYMGND